MKGKILAASILAATLGTSAHAARLSNLIDPSDLNLFVDQSAESILDIDRDGYLSEGDVFVGWIRMDDRTLPAPGTALDNQELYAVFTQQVETISYSAGAAVGAGTATLEIVPTTVAGLTLSDITGQAMHADAMAAVYTDIGEDLVNETYAAGDNILTMIGQATDGAFEFSAGFGSEPSQADDFWELTIEDGALTIFELMGAEGLSALLNQSQLAGGLFGADADYTGGLSVLDNESNLGFNENVFNATSLSLHEVSIINGDLSGACELYGGSSSCAIGGGPAATNPLFGDVTIGGTTYSAYGQTDNADVVIGPYVLPEPSVLALLGMGLVGLGLTGRRKRSA